MSIELANGIDLHVYPSDKYKTVHIKIKFTAPLSYETITARSFLSNMLETNSKKYPTQTLLRKELSNLYGASFGTSASKKGKVHVISAEMALVNDKFLGTSEDVLARGLDFLQEILFSPHTENQAFHEQTFLREKENLLDVYESYFDDKQLFAGLALQDLYFEEKSQKIPGAGTVEELQKITPASLYANYQKMLSEDKVDIYVLGDVTEEEITKALSHIKFISREVLKPDAFYIQEKTKDIKFRTDIQEVTQAKLNLGYQTDVYFHTENYYAGQVFNGLFGGFPHSKLFLNVREKESLAYYASSSLDTFRGLLTVQTGIEAAKAEQVKEIIQNQLEALREGDLDEYSLDQTKEMLINQLYQSEDDPESVMEREFAMDLAGIQQMTTAEWVQKIKDVTVEEIKEIAARTSLQAVYLLKGE